MKRRVFFVILEVNDCLRTLSSTCYYHLYLGFPPYIAHRQGVIVFSFIKAYS